MHRVTMSIIILLIVIFIFIICKPKCKACATCAACPTVAACPACATCPACQTCPACATCPNCPTCPVCNATQVASSQSQCPICNCIVPPGYIYHITQSTLDSMIKFLSTLPNNFNFSGYNSDTKKGFLYFNKQIVYK